MYKLSSKKFFKQNSVKINGIYIFCPDQIYIFFGPDQNVIPNEQKTCFVTGMISYLIKSLLMLEIAISKVN